MAGLFGLLLAPALLGVILCLVAVYGLIWLTIWALNLTHNYDKARRLTTWQRDEIRSLWACYRR